MRDAVVRLRVVGCIGAVPVRRSGLCLVLCFFFNDTATTEIYTFPYTTLFRSRVHRTITAVPLAAALAALVLTGLAWPPGRSEEHTSELQSLTNLVCRLLLE